MTTVKMLNDYFQQDFEKKDIYLKNVKFEKSKIGTLEAKMTVTNARLQYEIKLVRLQILLFEAKISLTIARLKPLYSQYNAPIWAHPTSNHAERFPKSNW